MIAKKVRTVMRDRFNWLKAWAKGRNYNLGSKRNEFLYIFFSTIRVLWSRQVSKDLLFHMNNMFSHPLEEHHLLAIIKDVEERDAPCTFRNQDIISRLGITPTEQDVLRIGHNIKEVAERAQRREDKKHRKADIEMMYGLDYTIEQIHEEYPQISERTIKRYIAEFRRKNRSEQEEQSLADEVIRLYQAGYEISGIARQTGSTVDEVCRMLNLESMTKFTTQETLRNRDDLPPFKVADCAELFFLSLQVEKSTRASLDEQATTLAILRTYVGNIALFGAAGTGKTYLIKKYLSTLSKEEQASTLIVAPTGRAADNLNAQTIHKAFRFPNDVLSADEVTAAPKELYSISRIIIDEVNLVRIDVFSRMVKTIQLIEKQCNKKIQIIALGDFGQIQPVATDEDIEAINLYYPNAKGIYAFQSELWVQLNFRKIILKQVHRQNDTTLIEKLNEIKYGKLSAIQWFNENASAVANPNAIYICPTNKLVARYNQEAIEKYDISELYTYTALISGDVPKDDYPCPEQLVLAAGMRVMTICNAERYKNGSMGTIVKINSKSIQVILDNGNMVTIAARKFAFQDGGSYEQLPVVLAYAITSNKAEGMTFDQVNVVPGYFAAGQLYTALSRAKTLDGIHIIGQLSAKDLVVDIAALEMTVDK